MIRTFTVELTHELEQRILADIGTRNGSKWIKCIDVYADVFKLIFKDVNFDGYNSDIPISDWSWLVEIQK